MMISSYENKIVRAVRRALPSIVSVVTNKNATHMESAIPGLNICIPENALPKDEDGKITVGGGSGFVVSDNGLILTNKHVVLDKTADYAIFDQEGKRYKAAVLGRDPIHDIAILRIKTKYPLIPITLGTAQNIVLGETVIAIGNVLGEFQSTVSTGVVSGLSRFVTATTDIAGHQERLRGLIQTDAAINPGNSGGPLLNLNGEVIGINAAVVIGAQNISFAIPIDKVKKDLSDLSAYGRIRRPFLGIRYILLNEKLKRQFHLPVNYGALVVKENIPGDHAVVPGSVAEKTGIREGDIVLSCNGKNITQKETLEDILENVSPGQSIQLTILRNGKKTDKQLALEEWK